VGLRPNALHRAQSGGYDCFSEDAATISRQSTETLAINAIAMPRRLLTLFALTFSLPGLLGCSGNGDRPRNPTEERLLEIGGAYVNAATRLGRAPRNFDDLKPNLENGATADFLRSPNDGEPFVVLWGVDFRKLPPGKDDPFTVAAYEKNGVDGKRYVLRFPPSVAHLTDEDLQRAAFPPGHKPPP
jgi:hypothetical protein